MLLCFVVCKVSEGGVEGPLQFEEDSTTLNEVCAVTSHCFLQFL